MKKIALALSLVALPFMASAQSTNSADASSQSTSQIITNEGDVRGGSSVGTPSANSTAPCVIGNSFGVGTGMVGLSVGTGTIDRDCVTQQEARILTQISQMRGEARRAAIMHFCINTESMRTTMVALGWCQVAE